MADAEVATATAIAFDPLPQVRCASSTVVATASSGAPSLRVRGTAAMAAATGSMQVARPLVRPLAERALGSVVMLPAWTPKAVYARASAATGSGSAQLPSRSIAARPMAAVGSALMQQQSTLVRPPQAILATGVGVANSAAAKISPQPTAATGVGAMMVPSKLVTSKPTPRIAVGVAHRSLADLVNPGGAERDDPQSQVEQSLVSTEPVRVSSSGSSGSASVSGASVPRVVISR